MTKRKVVKEWDRHRSKRKKSGKRSKRQVLWSLRAQMAIVVEAVEKQTAALSQVTDGIDQISSVVQTNSATSEQCAAASEELSSQANLLKDLMRSFKLRDIR